MVNKIKRFIYTYIMCVCVCERERERMVKWENDACNFKVKA